MSYDNLVSLIQQYGYVALFVALWLGIVGMPIPDEVVVMIGGAMTANGMLHPIPAFILTYLGVVSGLSVGYVLGRIFGLYILDRLRRKKGMDKYFNFSEKLMQKYGNFALSISYFFPIIRHVMPYMAGLNQMSFRRYAIYSYTAGFVWTLLFFTIGHLVGDHAQRIGMLIYSYGLQFLWLPLALILIKVFLRRKRNETDRASGRR
ncbi:DedA family protein [Paenibacillus planticolens]|uniref:DedA family protein n=1 Tax=Paenibacillus planticolens TaxID=2654976 RepID=A0ABX1ZEM5_9BACL|nr:DedA family protein [Paenibacillus planticolens]NOU98531.1 DedA family protein [Paenibacillus planticolens]